MSKTDTSPKDQARRHLRDLLLAEPASGDAKPADRAYFDDLRKRIKNAAKDIRAKRS